MRIEVSKDEASLLIRVISTGRLESEFTADEQAVLKRIAMEVLNAMRREAYDEPAANG